MGDTSLSITTFGLIHGDIIVADYNSGILYRLAPDAVAPPPATPTASMSRSQSTRGQVSTPTAPTPPSTYANRLETTRSDRTISIEWSVDGAYIHFQMTGTSTGYAAMGFSTDGSMNSGGQGSDIVMGFVNGQGFVNDYWTEARAQPELDEQQNLFHSSVVQSGSNLVLRFTRALNTADSFEDRTLSCSSQIYLIWAVSDSRPSDIDSFGYHAARGSFEVSNLCVNGISGTPSRSPSMSSTRTAAAASSSSVSPTRTPNSNPNPIPASSSPSGTPASNLVSASRTPASDVVSASRTPASNPVSASRTPAGVSASSIARTGTDSPSPNVIDISTDTESTSNFLSSLDDDSGSSALAKGTVFMLVVSLFYLYML